MSKKITSPLAASTLLILVGALLLLGYFSFKFLHLKQQQVTNQAIDGCAQVSINTFTIQTENQTNVIQDLNQKVYQECLQAKGVTKK